ncbi:hypothetical protein HDU91_000746 [Kappamyces sp. JEL0680]|nr:hypothetical protein HDU91_000746 [Kappamyces sp. JEL0680]
MGVQFSWLSVFLNSIIDFAPTIGLCYAIFVTEAIGFAIVFGTLVMKSARLVQFYRLKHSFPKFSDFFLLKSLVVYVCGIVGICAVACLATLPQPVTFVTYSQYSDDRVDFLRQCNMGSLNSVKLAFQGISLLVGLYVANRTSNVPAPFHEGTWIFRCLLNYLGTFVGFGVSVYFWSAPRLYVRLLGQIGGVVGSQLLVVLMMLVPKLFVDQERHGPRQNLSYRTSTASQITISEPEPVFIQGNPLPSSKQKGSKILLFATLAFAIPQSDAPEIDSFDSLFEDDQDPVSLSDSAQFYSLQDFNSLSNQEELDCEETAEFDPRLWDCQEVSASNINFNDFDCREETDFSQFDCREAVEATCETVSTEQTGNNGSANPTGTSGSSGSNGNNSPISTAAPQPDATNVPGAATDPTTGQVNAPRPNTGTASGLSSLAIIIITLSTFL